MSLSERRPSGIWTVHIDPLMPERDVRGYNWFIDKLAELPMASRYRRMAAGPISCIQAVNAWKSFGQIFPDYQLLDQFFLFNHVVHDAYGFEESGQDMLGACLTGSDNLLVADVAGYLFGFSYEEMLVAAGGLNFIGEQVTQHYSQKYPGLVATPRL